VRSEKLSILFAGGGTGGHLYPAIAVAAELSRLRPGVEITFAGTKRRIEARVVPALGYRFAPIWISGFRRKLSIGTVLFPVKVVVALVQSFFLIRKYRPAIVVGTGGYVSGPVVFVAGLLGIPTLIHEQNSYPGVTTRLLASRVDEVHLTFEGSARYLRRKDNVRFTGNPTRGEIGNISSTEGRKYFGLNEKRRTLLVFGGSQGAHSLNVALPGCIKGLVERGAQIIWQTGEEDYESARSWAASEGYDEAGGSVQVHKFIEHMQYAYGACDLAVCRAGATTIAELTKGGVPSVLVPYPQAAADHQTENARTMAGSGAAVLVRDHELGERLSETMTELLFNEEKLKQMSGKAKLLSRPEAATNLARAILALAGKTHVE